MRDLRFGQIKGRKELNNDINSIWDSSKCDYRKRGKIATTAERKFH